MKNETSSAVVPVPQRALCPQCHQPVPPGAYYCPNCGKKLDDPPLSKTLGAQLWLYAFSIILPFLGYLLISYWQGIKYARSNDADAQRIGWIAIVLFALSSVYVIWQITVLINGLVGTATSTAGLSSFGI